jgi:hypothetical protein
MLLGTNIQAGEEEVKKTRITEKSNRSSTALDKC